MYAQDNEYFNPDFDGDDFVGINDILGVLSTFGTIWQPLASGCTCPGYLEYSAEFVLDDGSCLTPVVFGCVDSSYLEYSFDANVDDGSCLSLAVYGCTNAEFEEFNPMANVEDGSCITPTCGDNVFYAGQSYRTVKIGDQCWFADNCRYVQTLYPYSYGSEDAGLDSVPMAYIPSYSPQVTEIVEDPDSTYLSQWDEYLSRGILYNRYAMEEWQLCPTNWKVSSHDDWEQLINFLGGEQEAADALKDSSMFYANSTEFAGTNSSGFNALATGHRNTANNGFLALNSYAFWWTDYAEDSQSLYFAHRALREEVFFSNYAGSMNGMAVRCIKATESPSSSNDDSDADGILDAQDDCIDTGACNYDASPSEPCAYLDVIGVCGGSCPGDVDGDGICDDEDTCVGVIDGCGVCNGPGPTAVVEDITILYDSVFLPQLEAWHVYEYGADTTFSYTCATVFQECGDLVSYQGYNYETVLIGDDCWFAENLRNENYLNGDSIAANLSDEEWNGLTTGATALFGEHEGCQHDSPEIDACDPSQSLAEYGRLYNWYAVDDPRGLCPSGWHVSSDIEWISMELELGMSEEEAFNTGWWRGTDQGTQLKSEYGWSDNGNGTNTVGFNGLPGGMRGVSGSIYGAGYRAAWWTSTPSGPGFRGREIRSDQVGISLANWNPKHGWSVRCIQDSE